MRGRMPAEPFAHQGGVLVMAHRGWSGRYPENTMLAFAQALELGVDALELDVHESADGVLVVSHDPTVNRMTDGQGAIAGMRWSSLEQLEVGHSWTDDGGETYPFRGQGLRLPSLEDVLAAFPDVWLNIDIKRHQASTVRRLVAMIRDYHVEARLCVGSFDAGTLRLFRTLCPEVVTAASSATVGRLAVLNALRLGRLYRPGPARALQVPPTRFGLPLVTSGFVRAAHSHGQAVHVWTVDDPREIVRLIDIGVDGLISNHPDRVIDALNGRLGN